MPNHISAYVRESEDSTSDLDSLCQRLAASVTWRTKHSAARTWLTRCNRDGWMKRLSGQMLEPSTASRGVEKWLESLAAIPASHSALPASDKERTTPATCGLKLKGSFAKYDPDGASLKMLQDTFGWDSTEYCVTLPKSGTMQSGQLSRLEMSGLRIKGSDYLFWRTPEASMIGGSEEVGYQRMKRLRAAGKQTGGVRNLLQDVQKWPTPQALELDRGDCPSERERRSPYLLSQTENWPTPRQTDVHGAGKHGEGGQDSRTTASEFSHQHQTTSKPGGKSSKDGQNSHRLSTKRLNPKFVEWLMSWPRGWTDFAPVATELSRYKQQWRSVLYRIIYGE